MYWTQLNAVNWISSNWVCLPNWIKHSVMDEFYWIQFVWSSLIGLEIKLKQKFGVRVRSSTKLNWNHCVDCIWLGSINFDFPWFDYAGLQRMFFHTTDDRKYLYLHGLGFSCTLEVRKKQKTDVINLLRSIKITENFLKSLHKEILKFKS